MKLHSFSFLLALKKAHFDQVTYFGRSKTFLQRNARAQASCTKNSSPYLVIILPWLHRRKNVAINGQ